MGRSLELMFPKEVQACGEFDLENIHFKCSGIPHKVFFARPVWCSPCDDMEEYILVRNHRMYLSEFSVPLKSSYPLSLFDGYKNDTFFSGTAINFVRVDYEDYTVLVYDFCTKG